MSVVVIATIVPRPEFRDAVIAALETAIGATHAAEPGVEVYALHEGEDRLIMIEKYADPDVLSVHRTSAHLAELGAALKGKLAAPLDVQVVTPHPAGDAARGAI